MESSRILRNSQIIILGLCIALATILSTLIFAKTLVKIKKFTSEVIQVTGSAEKKIVSDLSIWHINLSSYAPQMSEAYDRLKTYSATVRHYLGKKGLKDNEIFTTQIYTETIYKRNLKGYTTNEIEGFRLSKSIDVQSTNVYLVTEVSRKITSLLKKGVNLSSDPPQYFYTNLAQLKLDMISQATEDAKNRAQKMADATGNEIGHMHSADMGVFQITSVNSTEVSNWGVNDTSSLEKKVTAVVHVDFGIKE